MGNLMSYRTWPYQARFVVLVLICTVANLLGLEVTEYIGKSVLFFDMVGTAIASFSNGLTAGICVAILSGFFGAELLGQDHYFLFSIVNIAGAVGWSVLPRIGQSIFGARIFDPNFPYAYRRELGNIMILGIAVGFLCTFTSFVVQSYVLDFSIHSNDGMYAVSAGSNTSFNNIVMALSLHNILGEFRLPGGVDLHKEIILFASAAISNIPDKMIATVSAVFVIFAFGTLPNYVLHKKAINEDRKLKNCNVIDNKIFLLLLAVTSVSLLSWYAGDIMRDIRSVVAVMIISVPFILVAAFDPAFVRSLDRHVRRDEADRSQLFFHLPVGFRLEDQRHVFEDILKVIVITLSCFTFGLAVGSTDLAVRIDGVDRVIRATQFYQLAAVNILILTGYRYSFVIFIRLFGRA